MATIHNHRLSSIAALVLAAAPAWAAPVTYDYSGNAFNNFSNTGGTPYTSTDHVTVSVTLASVLGANFNGSATATAFSISDGRFLFNPLNVTNSLFDFKTDASGTIVEWYVYGENFAPVVGGGVTQFVATENFTNNHGLATQDSGQDVTCGVGSSAVLGCEYGGTGFTSAAGYVSRDAGTWSVEGSAAVPEPSALALAGLALSMLAFSARSRTSKS